MVVEALDDFASQYADPNAYENWLEKENYRYAIDYKGKFYPPKHILSVVTGISTSEFSGGNPTNHVFEQLGFSIVAK